MDKDLYLEFRKLKKEEDKRKETLDKINKLLSYKSYFKEEKSMEAFEKISEYYNKLARKRNSQYRCKEIDLQNACSHEVLIPTGYGFMCAVCGLTMGEENIKNSIVLNTKEHWLGFELIDTICSIIDDLVSHDKDILENFESEFERRMEELTDLTMDKGVLKELKLRRVKNGK